MDFYDYKTGPVNGSDIFSTKKTGMRLKLIEGSLWKNQTRVYTDYRGEQVKRTDYEYSPEKDILYKKLQNKPINSLSVDDVIYLFAIHYCIYMKQLAPFETSEQAVSDAIESHDEELIDCHNYISNLRFPLTIYRAVRQDELNKSVSGQSWTTNIEIYKNDKSIFRGLSDIVACEINPGIIDNASTIDNYVHYTARPQYGRFGEYEITLKKNFKTNELKNLREIEIDKL